MNIDSRQLFYNGERQHSTSEKYLANINPSNAQLISEVGQASAADVEKAVISAQRGFEVWSKMTGTERGRVLKKAADILRERNEELAKIEVMDTGKPLSEAISVDIISGADAIEYYAGLAPTIKGDYHDLGGSFAYTRREPLGVVAGIGAWNYPIQIACWKSGPALACGNAMIFKPAELTPLSAVFLAEVYKEAGLPDGVFNIVQGDAEVGKMLTAHPAIKKVSLTGEVGTGKKVMAAAAETLKHVTLELGGKSPLIICEDADLDEAVQGAMIANFYTQGEICSNGTRVYVEESVKEVFLEKLIEKTKKLITGDPMDMRTHIGALISQEHMEKVLGYIDQGKKEANLMYGGNRFQNHHNVQLNQGYFIEPTIFYTENEEAIIAKEEIFGPVMTVLPFKTEEEVIRKANDTIYGLAAGIFTRDLQRAHRMVDHLEAGMCWINNYNITPVEIPFGPYKQSGFGKENGLATIEAYTQLKTVYVEMDKIDSPYR
ncbi:betaine-aldehyde dehydrogenase [Echinicola shivajiensis]|uniref:betaine-aldehyde dehydrogenase n=1 Tax=Echinicola shivajiensis TaxID=1035916 RepID=UPI001BFC2557|nr:betaine-aldehyde dehydrogenase [Echinicola shivajiensis]